MKNASIDVRVYSPNQTDSWHWAKRRRVAQQTKLAVFAALGRCVPGTKGHRRLALTICGPRALDTDNAYRACKPVVDALRHWGWIEDDTTKLLELEVTQEKCSKRSVKVEIMETKDANTQQD